MNHKRVFYYNLLYRCNNHCVFCFSHNTNKIDKDDISLNDVKIGISKFLPCKADRFVLNGGEPTLCKELQNIVTYLKQYSDEILLYSNGRMLAQPEFANKIFKAGISRVTIPIHGPENVHDKITSVRGSYQDAVKGLQNTILCKKLYNIEVELKLILSANFIASYRNPAFIFSMIGEMSKLDCVILSGMVETKVAIANQCFSADYRKIAEISSEIIEYIQVNYPWINIKLENICLSCLKGNIQFQLKNSDVFREKINYDFYYFDKNVIEGKKDAYNDPVDDVRCIGCTYREVCSRIEKSYRVLKHDETWHLDYE